MFNALPSLPFTVLKIYIWVSYIYHLYGAIFHLALERHFAAHALSSRH